MPGFLSKFRRGGKGGSDQKPPAPAAQGPEPPPEASPAAPAPPPAASDEAVAEQPAAQEAPAAPDGSQQSGCVLSVRVHRTDGLKPNRPFLHPLVCVHAVDKATGEYLRKKRPPPKGRRAAEQQPEAEPLLLPVMTQPYETARGTASAAAATQTADEDGIAETVLPVWDEELELNEDYNNVAREGVLLLFEVLDFGKMSLSRGIQKGFARVAWAFVSVVGSHGPNLDKELRLQLYKYPKHGTYEQIVPIPEVYGLWKRSDKDQLEEVDRPVALHQTQRLRKTFSELQVEHGMEPDDSYEDSESTARTRSELGEEEEDPAKEEERLRLAAEERRRKNREKRTPKWTRAPGEPCRVPNILSTRLEASAGGSLALSFSPDGLWLAAACADALMFPLYEIAVSENDEGEEVIEMLPQISIAHSCFVYASRAHPVLFTGALDKIIRVWSVGEDNDFARLIGKLEGHSSNVNALCFSQDGRKLVSADGAGDVRVWIWDENRQSPSSYTCFKTLSYFKGRPICSLVVHPSKPRVLVFVRDSIIYSVDLRSFEVVRTYVGHQCTTWHIHGDISPDGCYVISGSENRSVYIWNEESGGVARVFESLGIKGAISSSKWHPVDNCAAVCGPGENYPVLFCSWDMRKDAAASLASPGKTKEKAPGAVDMAATAPARQTQRMEEFRRMVSSTLAVGASSLPPSTGSALPQSATFSPRLLSSLESPKSGALQSDRPLRLQSTLDEPPSPAFLSKKFGDSKSTISPRDDDAAPSESMISQLERPIDASMTESIPRGGHAMFGMTGGSMTSSMIGTRSMRFDDTADGQRRLQRMVRQRRRESELTQTIITGASASRPARSRRDHHLERDLMSTREQALNAMIFGSST
eukprot:m51a1_g2247 putative jouberin isoform x1 (871) ;mRNA; f:290161-293683